MRTAPRSTTRRKALLGAFFGATLLLAACSDQDLGSGPSAQSVGDSATASYTTRTPTNSMSWDIFIKGTNVPLAGAGFTLSYDNGPMGWIWFVDDNGWNDTDSRVGHVKVYLPTNDLGNYSVRQRTAPVGYFLDSSVKSAVIWPPYTNQYVGVFQDAGWIISVP